MSRPTRNPILSILLRVVSAAVPVALVIVGLIFACSRSQADQAESAPPVRETMDEIFEALRVLAPIAYRNEALGGTPSDGPPAAALVTLAASARALEQHAKSRDPGFAYLASGLTDRAQSALRLVRSGHDDDARRVVRGMVEQCVACHARVPSAREFPLGDLLLGAIDAKSLTLRERANLELATRRFDVALATYEELLRIRTFANAGAPDPELVRYLALCLSGQGDRARAVRTLAALRERPDITEPFREDLAAWIASIGELRAEELEGPRLARARTLLTRSAALADQSSGRRALVFDLEARLELQHFLDAVSELSPEVAFAYYSMGVIEERIWDRPWLSNAAPFLEESIRLGHTQPFARDAHERLERIWILGYTGSGGTRVPPEVRKRLDELGELVRGGRRS